MSVALEVLWPSGHRETVLLDQLHLLPDGTARAVVTAPTEGDAP